MNKSPYRHWRPSRFIRASVGLHIGSLTAMALAPTLWPLCLGLILADHALLFLAGMIPRSSLLGPNRTRLKGSCITDHQIAITIDDGPDPLITPAVLELLDQHGVKASFFLIGEKVLQYPDLAREIIRRGHTAENHTFHHGYNFALLGPDRLLQELELAQDVLTSVTGVRPIFFRAPAGLRNPFLEPVLCRLGLYLTSWTRRGFDTCNRDAEKVTASLLNQLKAGDILLLHDGNAARTANGHAVILEVLPNVLNGISAAGLKPVTLRTIIE